MSGTVTISRSPTARAAHGEWRLTPRGRRAVLVLHVVSSVGWLGLTAGNLVLAITAATTTSPRVQHAIHLVLALLGDALLLPTAVTAFATGLVLAVWTRWGLLRHRWVAVKLVLTSAALVLTPSTLLPGVREAAAITAATPADRLADLGGEAAGLVVASSVSLTAYLTCVVLSVVKPWGRTRWGARESR